MENAHILSMFVEKTRQGDFAVFYVRGEVDLYNSDVLKQALIQSIRAGARTLVVDLDDVGYMDSSGIGALIAARAAAEKEGGRVVLSRLQAGVASVFRLTRLDSFFEIFTAVDEAAGALARAAV